MKNVASSNEWYTPSRYIEAARTVMGGIDLDPASCALANETVRATTFYSKDDDGLSKDWKGRVFCNPPFTTHLRGKDGLPQSSIGFFCTKLIREYEAGNVEQAIFLAMPSTDTKWFQPLWAYLICFVDHRLKFGGPRRFATKSNTFNYGTIFVYLGPNEQKFIDIFAQFGAVARRVSQPKVDLVRMNLWEAAS